MPAFFAYCEETASVGDHRAAPDPAGLSDQVLFPYAADPSGRSPVDLPGQFISPLVSSPPPDDPKPAGQNAPEKNRRAQEGKEKSVIKHGEPFSRKQGKKGRPAESDSVPGPVVLVAPQPGMGRNGQIQPPSVPEGVVESSEEGRRVRQMLEHVEQTGRGQGFTLQAEGFEGAANDVGDPAAAGVPASVQARFEENAPESMPGQRGGHDAVSSSDIPDISGGRKTPQAAENDAVAMGEPPGVILDDMKDAASVRRIRNRFRGPGRMPDTVAVFGQRNAGAGRKAMSGQSSSSSQMWKKMSEEAMRNPDF